MLKQRKGHIGERCKAHCHEIDTFLYDLAYIHTQKCILAVHYKYTAINIKINDDTVAFTCRTSQHRSNQDKKEKIAMKK